MIVVINYGKYTKFDHIKANSNDKQVINVEKIDIEFINDELLENQYITIIHNEKIHHNAHIVYTKKDEYAPVDLFFLNEDDNIGSYSKFRLKDSISIGSNGNADIVINSPYVSENDLVIDTKSKMIINNGNLPYYINNVLSQGEFPNNISILTYLNLRLCICDQFLMVYETSNITINLDSYVNIFEESNVCTINKKLYVKPFRTYNSFEPLKVIIRDYQNIYKSEEASLIISMGPAITMSIASLSSGLISSYNGYMQGRELLDLLPMLILPLVMIISTVLWNPLQRVSRNRKYNKKVRKAKQDYETYLDGIISKIKMYKDVIRAHNHTIYYSMNKCVDMINGKVKGLWEKTRTDSDYLCLALGNGEDKCLIDVTYNGDPNSEYYEEVSNLIVNAKRIENSTLKIDLKENKDITVLSKEDDELLFRYLLLQLITYFAYDLLKIVFICDEKWYEDHSYIKHIPHLQNNDNYLIATTIHKANEISNYLKSENKDFICFNIDSSLKDLMPKEGNFINIVHSPSKIGSSSNAIVLANQYDGMIKYRNSETYRFVFDDVYTKDLGNILIKLRNISLKDFNDYNISNVNIYSINNINNVESLRIENRWQYNHTYNDIKGLIGINNNNEKVYINLHEKGQGPHGLIAGTTGSGKSELLTTLILSLCINYSYADLQFIIIDFKGSGLINVFSNNKYCLPHLAGYISNLDENNLERCLISFNLECKKRQEYFNKMSELSGSSLMNIDIYQKVYDTGYNLPYLSHLVIIVDEFAELKKAEPEFMNDLMSISRIGRSLGIHLILSTQKPSGQVDDQIWSNARFKICLKVQDKQDSYDVIHTNDAVNLKQAGDLYFLFDENLEKCRCAYSNETIDIDSINRYVALRNESGEVIDKVFDKPKTTIKQVEAIVKYMEDISCNINVNRNIWKEELSIEEFPSINDKHKSLLIGKIDDIYHRTQYNLFLKPFNNYLIFGLNEEERSNFLKLLLVNLIYINDKKEVFILSDSNEYDKFKKSTNIIDVISSDDEEKVNNLIRYINKQNNHEKIIIIDNYQIQTQNEYIKDMIMKLAATSTYNTKIYVFTLNYQSIPYKLLSLIPDKIALSYLDHSEISAIFDINSKKECKKNNFGIIKNDRILNFMFFAITKYTIERCLIFASRTNNETNKLTLPKMELVLKGLNTCIGKSYDTYNFIEISKGLTLLFSRYTDAYTEYLKLLSTNNNIVNTINDFKKDKINIINDYISFEKKLNNNEINEFINIIKNNEFKVVTGINDKQFHNTLLKDIYNYEYGLWLGPGFNEQFILNCKCDDTINDKQGIYYQKGKGEKIKLIDEQFN